MNLTLRTQGFSLTAAIDAYVRSRMTAALARHEDGVVSVQVFLRDTNGPRGGDDKSALVCVHLRDGQTVTIESVHADLYAATRLSARRARRAVARGRRKQQRLAKRELRLLRQTQQLPVTGSV